MVTANLATIVGIGLIATALIAVFFSPYRRWLSFMLAGMLVWGLIEVIRFGTQTVFELPMAFSYLTAVTSAIMVFTLILLREDRRAERAVASRRYIEHTPVYEDDQQQCSSR
ncbi:ciprofloxacin tolerance protein AciT [Acinetobacter sp.]|uniref:ciprofloxacin tolerance protein AciT n=1 Tax=Acinetobacter sp. TaxID=472 RepID=UPI0035B08CB2